jgi:ABC-type dipeptide/oligopeptide/nickel transport system permease component
MPKLTLTHFEASVLFAFFVSIVLGIVSKKTDRERLRYGLKCFGYFLLALFAIGWVMRLGHG